MKEWYTLEEIAAQLHVGTRHARRLLAPYRADCHLARKRGHPRLILWIPAKIVETMRKDRADQWQTKCLDIVSGSVLRFGASSADRTDINQGAEHGKADEVRR